ncbi:MAG: hypothetical protein ACUVRY_04645 [Thermoanaerobaculaceae bacterium]
MDWRVRLCLGPAFGGNGKLFRHSPSRVLVAQHGEAWIEDGRGRRAVADFLSTFEEELRRGDGWAVGFLRVGGTLWRSGPHRPASFAFGVVGFSHR